MPAIWCLLSSPDLHHPNHSANTFLFLSLIHLLNNPLPENVSLILFISTPPSLIPSLRNIYARFNSILLTNSEFLLWSSPPGKFTLTSSEVINALCIFPFTHTDNKETFLALLQQNKEQRMLIRFVVDGLSVHFMLLLRMMVNVVWSHKPGAS